MSDDAELRRKVQRLAAAEDIRKLVGDYCDAIARLDLDAVATMWSEDAAWTVMGLSLQGRDAIMTRYRQLLEPVLWIVQHATAPSITVDGDRAEGIWQVVEYGQRSAGEPAGLIHVGRYLDRYARSAEGWRFTARTFVTLGHGAMVFDQP
jgi:uncharacterized protein (TIGR02246 family)